MQKCFMHHITLEGRQPTPTSGHGTALQQLHYLLLQLAGTCPQCLCVILHTLLYPLTFLAPPLVAVWLTLGYLSNYGLHLLRENLSQSA